MKRKPVSIVIPSFNGKELLKTCLPSAIDALEHYGDGELIVVDDESNDGTAEFLQGEFPKIKMIALRENKGYGGAVNAGVAGSYGEVILLLNNDVGVEKGFLAPLVEHFENESVFAVAAKSLVPDKNMANESVSRLEFNDGLAEVVIPGLVDPAVRFEDTCTTLHACGGFSAFDRKKFVALGGMDDLYYPFYWEDVDLCYRAWKRGWWVLYEPRSIVCHRPHGTIGRLHSEGDINRIYIRNGFLFFWKNFTDEAFLMAHLKRLNASNVEERRPAFYEAMKRIMEVLKKRKEQKVDSFLEDHEVIRRSANLRYPTEFFETMKSR